MVAGSTVSLATLHNADEVAPQGRADRRPGRHPQGGRRHPGGARPGRRRARRHRARVRHADALPGVRHRAGPAEGGRRRPALPQRPLLPGAVARAAVPRRRAGRVRHRGARLRGGRRAARRRRGAATRATSSPSTEDDLLQVELFRDEGGRAVGQRPQAAGQPRRGQGPAAVAGAGGPVDPARRPDRGAGAGPRVRVDGGHRGRGGHRRPGSHRGGRHGDHLRRQRRRPGR